MASPGVEETSPAWGKAEWEAATKRPSQAGSLPDPIVGVGWRNVRFDRITLTEDPNSMVTFSLSQEFPFPGKLSLREKVAQEEAQAQEKLYEATLRRVIADLKEAYYNWFLVDKSIEITLKNKDLLEKFLKVAEEVTLGVKVPLYFYRKQRFGVQEAVSQLQAAREDYTSTNQSLFFNVKDQYLVAKTSENLLKLFQEGIIPQAASSLESAITGDPVGNIDFLTLLNNLVTLFNFEITYYT